MGLAEIAGPTVLPGPRPLREGHDFTDQRQLQMQAAGLVVGETRPAPPWAVLAWRALWELEAAEWSGQLASRGERVPAFQAELWGAYCRGRALRRAGEERG